MRGAVFALLSLVALSVSVAVTHVYARADDDQATTINIVEPPFQSPQRRTYDANDPAVAPGATVTWTNTGAVAHTMTADDGASFDSASLDPQATFSFTTTTPGTFTYYCAFHPWMTGTLTVSS